MHEQRMQHQSMSLQGLDTPSPTRDQQIEALDAIRMEAEALLRGNSQPYMSSRNRAVASVGPSDAEIDELLDSMRDDPAKLELRTLLDHAGFRQQVKNMLNNCGTKILIGLMKKMMIYPSKNN